MNTITNANIRDFIVNGTWTINGSMKSDEESEDKVNFTLNVKYDNVPVVDVINKSLEPTKISWVNAQGRKHIEKYPNKSIVNINFKSPATTTVDGMTAVRNETAGMSKAEKLAYLKNLEAQLIEE